jgi:hypothetical protein
MSTFTIDADNNITAFPTPDEAAAAVTAGAQSFDSQQELAQLAAAWPAERLLAVRNSLPGDTPVTKLKDPKAAIRRIWARIQHLGEPAKPKAERKASAGTQPAKGAPAKAKAKQKTSKARVAKAARKARPQKGAAREGSKAAQVVAMLHRKGGATLTEIMSTTGWQKHTVRGFIAGAMKKAGHPVESFKPEGGERTYRITR